MASYPPHLSSNWDTVLKAYVDQYTPDGGVKAVGKSELRTVDSDYPSLEAALTATSDGGTLEVRTAWTRTAPWVVAKTVTVEFARSGRITVTAASTDAIQVKASGVTLRRPYIVGAGAATAGTGCGISAIGTAAAPITDLAIERPHVDSYDKYGIYLENVTDYSITTPAISNIAYAGIMQISCIRGEIRRGSVRTITQPTGFTNSYGIAMSRDSTKTLTDSPRSQSIKVDGTLVSGVPLWEGIDTHGGADLTITSCRVENCNVGIALVASQSGGADTYAPLRVTALGNTIDSGVTDGSRSNGIQLVGAGATVGSPVEAASGCVILGNTIIGHGNQAVSTSQAGAIISYFTSKCVIANNTTVAPGFCGIHVYHTNAALTVTGNSVEDAWSNAQAFTAILYVRSNFNSLNVGSTRVIRGSVSATQVNSRGLQVSAGTTNNTVNDLAGNEWANCALPSSGAAGTLMTGFYGTPPVVKPAVSGAKGSNAALASLLSQLAALGLITDSTTA